MSSCHPCLPCAVAIEEPFSILPLDELCVEVEAGLSDVLEQAAATKRAAQEAVTAAAAAAVSAAAAEAAAEGSGSGSDEEPPAAANGVAPLMLGRASLSRQLARGPDAEAASANGIFASLDDFD